MERWLRRRWPVHAAVPPIVEAFGVASHTSGSAPQSGARARARARAQAC